MKSLETKSSAKTWNAVIYFENGQVFEGRGFGAQKSSGGEIVFNTGMTGYQEIFTDPSYCRQIVLMTYPHIGSTGSNLEDIESDGIFLSGVVAREFVVEPSNWRSTKTLNDYLVDAGVPGIFEVDTREMTRIIRSEGSQRAVIFPVSESEGDLAAHGKKLLESVSSMEGQELVSEVSCREPYQFEGGSGELGEIIVYDFGVKTNILRLLRDQGFKVSVVPYNYPAEKVLASKPAAVFLTNGPGDPALVDGAVEQVTQILGKIPLMAICMGHQIVARALGASTYKMKFGHHGVNHPVKDLESGRILITSQNHGFAVKADTLKGNGIRVSHVSLNDQTLEGFESPELRVLSVQFHPEAKPGPSDAAYLFEKFVRGYVK